MTAPTPEDVIVDPEFSGTMAKALALRQATTPLLPAARDAMLAALREPAWPQRAAAELGVPWREAPYPPQYTRGAWPKG